MMRRCAGLYANQAGRQLLKERKNATTLQLTANDHIAFSVDGVDLKHRLGDVEADGRNRLHVGSSESWGPKQHPLPWHSRAGGGGVPEGRAQKAGGIARAEDLRVV